MVTTTVNTIRIIWHGTRHWGYLTSVGENTHQCRQTFKRQLSQGLFNNALFTMHCIFFPPPRCIHGLQYTSTQSCEDGRAPARKPTETDRCERVL